MNLILNYHIESDNLISNDQFFFYRNIFPSTLNILTVTLQMILYIFDSAKF